MRTGQDDLIGFFAFGAQIGNGEIDYWAKNVKIQKWLGWLKRVKLG